MIFGICMMILSACLQVFVLQTFMEPLNLISGGFTGIALFIHRLAARAGMDIPTSILIILLNTPAAALCVKFISKRFVFLSCIQYVLVSLFLNVFHFQPLFDEGFLNLLFGGIMWGFSISLALRAGGSTGGTDFIAQFVSNTFHVTIFQQVFYFNCFMYIMYGYLFGWIYAGYSIIFQYLSTQAITAFYHKYAHVTVSITTYDPDSVIDAFLAVVQHGMSVYEATGAYKGQKVYICQSVINSFEVQEVIHNVRVVDPHCIINTWKTQSFVGNFHQKPIE
jgi:uncharacterized membrane-anchored protein YitT (DUF2179 family)